MQSVPQFIQGITSADPAHDVTHNFNKMMVMYRLLGGRSDVRISTTTEEDGKTSFEVDMKSQKEASAINERINGTSYSVYGRSYEISSSQNKKVVRINIKKENAK